MTRGTVFGQLKSGLHELVVHAYNPGVGLRAIVAIHSRTLGPALGGARLHPYKDEATALRDVLRLSQGMSLKAAAADLPLGGGKAVLIAEPSQKSPELMKAFGAVVDTLGGSYITAEDVGTTVDDMVWVSQETRWVTGLPCSSGGSGDPSPLTARGVRAAMLAVVKHLSGERSLSGWRIAVQGVGKVGGALARSLAADGADLVLTDTDWARAQALGAELGAAVVEPGDILRTSCDILAPCALGAVLSKRTIPTLQCKAVVGSANNQLDTDADATLLASRSIVYVPDFVANAGGIINISAEFNPIGYDSGVAEDMVDKIFGRTSGLLIQAAERSTTPHQAAVEMAYSKIRAKRV